MRTCTKCKQEKPTTDFSVRKNRKSGFKSWCKSCESKSVIERRDLQKWNEYQRQYYQQNRFIYIQNANKRHRIKKQSCLKLDEFNTLWMEELYDLAQRRTIITKIPWEVDHIIPLQNKIVCGLHVPWNMQVITRSENRTKSNKLTEIKF